MKNLLEEQKDFSSTIAAAMRNPEQMLQINKMLNKANFELNRKENLACNITRVSEKEIWKNLGEVKNFEQYSDYEVSTFGQVKSLDYKNSGKERVLKPVKRPNGYLQVGLTTNGKRKFFFIHRIVASAFVKNDDPENKTVCNHINHGSKTDNHYKNLEWVSPKENTQAFYEYDLEKVAERSMKISEANKGKKISDETRKKMSEANSGENNPNFGKKLSDETKQKISEAKKGKMLGENHPNFGKKYSDESRKKMSEAKKGKCGGENHPNFGKFGAAHPNFGKKYKKKAKSS